MSGGHNICESGFVNRSIMRRLLTFAFFIAIAFPVSGESYDLLRRNLKSHIQYLSSDVLQGRKTGTKGEKMAAEYLYDALESNGVIMLTDRNGQDFTIMSNGDSIHSRNIVGIIEGCDSLLRDEYIVVGAHFDHLGTNNLMVDGTPVTQIFAGADDNASGVATLIELSRLVSENRFDFPRSIIFVGFGAKEHGMAGSWYFVNRAFQGIGNVKAMINLDMLGRGNAANPFKLFSQVSTAELNPIKEESAKRSVSISPAVADATISPSDFLPFYEAKIPVFFFTTGKHREYHTVRDTPKLILYNNLVDETIYIFNFLEVMANKEELFKLFNASSKEPKEPLVKEDGVYSVLECDKRPEFFHSDEKHFLESWVYKYIKYPKAAISKGIQGIVEVEFIIEKDGSVTNVRVVRGVDDLLDEEAVRVISVSPKWIPGRVGGKKVRTKITLPVLFILRKG